MNAICGVWTRAGDVPDGLDGMLAALPCRETDAGVAWTDGPVRLGGRGDPRVTDDPSVRWPYVDRAAGLAVAASARLDDRDALADALGIPRPQRAGLPDGEFILRAYERWGDTCPERLLGDYAFAVWDARRRRLFCARDHIGTRPFYYHLGAQRVVFASGVAAVLAAPGVSGALDESAVATRLTYGGRPFGAHTFFRAVRRLLPGHALAVEGGAASIARWWRPENVPPVGAASDGAHAEAFLDLYARAVEDRLRGAGPVGVHLSGGLDSSSIAVLAARALRDTGRPAPIAFGWHPPPGDGPLTAAAAAEYGPIEAVSRQEGLRVCYRPPAAADALAFLRRDVALTEGEPTLAHEEVVQRCAAERGVRIMLSGWGGDEGISFDGRGYYPQLLREGRLGVLWREFRERGRRPLRSILTEAALPLLFPRALPVVDRLRRGEWPVRKRTFIHPEFARRARLLPPPVLSRAGVRAMQISLLQHGHLGARMEGWAVRGACHGIEYRYPLLDRRVLEFALGLPPEQFRRGRRSRCLMRRALGTILPPEVCWNPTTMDPTRYGPLEDAFADALPAVRSLLEARAAPPSRSRYLDMPRLTADLDAARFRRHSRRWAIVHALRFLDF